MDTINPLSSILPVGSATSQGRGRSHGQQFPATGQILKAVVLETNGNDRFVLDIGGNRLSASSQAALSPGQILQLQVTRTQPQIELKIVNDTLSRFVGRSLTLLNKNIDLTALFAAMDKHIPPMLQQLTPTSRNVLEGFFALQQTPFGDKNDGVVLKQLTDRLGLNLERLLAAGDKVGAMHTLKAALLEIAHHFSAAEHLAETTQKILTTLELFQIAQLHTNSPSQQIFPLPLPFVEQGYLVVEEQGKDIEGKRQKEEESRFSLHLTMADIGNLRIDFLQNPAGLYIRFHADSQETADFIAAHSDSLEAAITGIPVISLAFSSGALDPINELIRHLLPDGNSMLDTKV
ncbi:MAG: hypothetical protein OEL83_13185 [Desulforhopalus sp.]|nr:hypothetical protein [Desulforhopalus sp.]